MSDLADLNLNTMPQPGVLDGVLETPPPVGVDLQTPPTPEVIESVQSYYFKNDSGTTGQRTLFDNNTYTGNVNGENVSGTYIISGDITTYTRTSPSNVTIEVSKTDAIYDQDNTTQIGDSVTVTINGVVSQSQSYYTEESRDAALANNGHFVDQEQSYYFINESGTTGQRTLLDDGTYTGVINNDESSFNISGTYIINGDATTYTRTSPSNVIIEVTKNQSIYDQSNSIVIGDMVTVKSNGVTSQSQSYHTIEARDTALDNSDTTDTVSNDISTNATVIVGETYDGNIETNYDQDWIKVTLQANQYYQIDLKGLDSSSGTLENPVINSIFDNNGMHLEGTYNDDGGQDRDAKKEFLAKESGEYFISVEANNSTGTYSLSVIESEGPLLSATSLVIEDTETLEDNSNMNFASYDESDFYKVSLDAGTQYKFTANSDTDYGWMNIIVLDNNGNKILDGINNHYVDGTDSSIIFSPESGGYYYLEVKGSQGDYSLTTQNLGILDQHGDDIDHATELVFNNNIATIDDAQIHMHNDYDYFSMTVEDNDVGASYLLQAKNSDQYGSMEIRVFERSETGENEIYDYEITPDNQKKFTPSSAGEYFFRLNGSEGNHYTFDVEKLANPLEIAEVLVPTSELVTYDTSSPSTNDDSYTINSLSDEDYFKVNLTKGNQYIFQADITVLTQEQNQPTSTYSWMDIRILDTNGNEIWDGIENSSADGIDVQKVFIPSNDGDYYLKINGSKGEYNISIKDNGIVDKYGNNFSDAKELTFPDSSTEIIVDDAKLHNGTDEDYFSLQMTAGKSYTLSADYKTHESAWIDIAVFDENRNEIWDYETNQNTEANAQKIFTPVKDGTYFFKVKGDSGADYDYTFEVKDNGVVDKYGNNIESASSLTLTDGSVTVTDATIHNWSDQDYFSINIDSTGESYLLQANSADANFGWMDIEIYDSMGGNIWNFETSHNSIDDAHKTFTPTQEGTYYFALKGSAGFDYTFGIEKLANPLDVAEVLVPTSELVTYNSSSTNDDSYTLTSFDEDYFKVELTAGHQYKFLANSDSTSDWVWMQMNLLDSSGNDIWNGVEISAESTTDNQELVFTPIDDGDYYLKVNGAEGAYSIGVQDSGIVDIHSNSIINATELTLDVEIGGKLHNWNDEDYFTLDLEDGETYLLNTNMTDKDFAWMDISIYNTNGSQVWNYEDNWDTSANKEIIFTPTTEGKYFFKVDGDSGSDYEYTFNIEKLSDDGKQNTDTEMSITLTDGTGSTTGSLERAYDEDWIAVSLVEGKSYIINLSGVDLNTNALDTSIRGIYNSDGHFIEGSKNEDYDGGIASQVSFMAERSETYYISAGANGSSKGTYTLSVEEEVSPLETAEVLSITSSEATVSTGSNSDSFTIDSYKDEDYYKLTSLEAGKQYTFKANSTSSDSWTWMNLNILNANGIDIFEGIEYTWDENNDAQISFIPKETGNYFLKVNGNDGTYTLSTINEGVVDLYGNSIDEASGLTLANNTVTVSDAQFHNGSDEDYFSLVVEDGHSYTLSANIDSTDWTWMNIDIYDTNGMDIWDYEMNWNSSVDVEKTFTPTTASAYYFRVDGTENNPYSFTVTDNGAVDLYGDTITDAESLTLNEGSILVADAKIHNYNDKDVFAVELEAGESYQITANNTDNTSWNWLEFNVKDANGIAIWDGISHKWDSNFDKEVTFNVTTDSTYYFEVMGSKDQDYTFAINTLVVATDSASEDVNTSAIITLSDTSEPDTGSYSGNIETGGDADWIKVTLDSTKNYIIDLQGAGSNLGTLSDTYLKGIYDSTGTLIDSTMDDNSGFGIEAQLEFSPTNTGTYFISTGAYGSNTGTYTLNIAEVANPLSTAETLTISTSESTISATAESNTDSFTLANYNDKDYFKISLTAGNEYVFKANSNSSDWQWMQLNILDSSGNEIWDGVDTNWNTDNDAEISFVAATSSDFFIKVNGSNGAYSITTIDNGIVDKYANSITDLIADTNNIGDLTLTDNTVSVTDGQLHNWNDSDYFSLDIEANYKYTVSLDSSSAWWMELAVYNAEGTQLLWEDGVEYNWDTTVDKQLSFTTQNAGTYYFKVDGEEGEYLLDITKSTDLADDHSNTTVNATALTVAASATTGKINESYDNDYFTVDLTAGTRYEIVVDSTDLVSNDWGYNYADFGVELYDSNNNWLGWENGVITDWNYSDGVKKTFEVSTTGTYYIDVAGYNSQGAYAINVDTVTDDFDSATDATNNGLLTVGTGVDYTEKTVSGVINYVADEDWFSVSLDANSTYEFSIDSNDMEWSFLDIKDSNGEYVWDNVFYDWNWTTNTSTITFDTTTTTDYFLSVGGEEGSYTISATKKLVQTDDDNSIATATEIVLLDGDATTTVTDIFSKNDEDYFKVNLVAGETYNIAMITNITNGLEYGGYFDLVDSIGNYILDGVTYNWEEQSIDFTVAATNTYYLNIASWGDTGNYQIKIDKQISDSVGNSITNFGDFETLDSADGSDNDTITNALETYSDNDWFKVDAINGQIYTITLDSSDMQWPYLTVYDKNGEYMKEGVSWDYSATQDNKVYFTATSDDDFFIEVNAWETGTYDLSVTSIDNPDDFGSSVTNNGVFASIDASDTNVDDNTVFGTLETNYDKDWFKVSVVENTTYEIILDSDTMSDIYLNILNNSGEYIWSGISWDWTTTEDDKLFFTADSSADYFVQVSGWNSIGEYTLEFKEKVDPDTVGNSITEYGVFATLDDDTNNGTADDNIVAGTLDSTDDQDWYSYSMVAGNTYAITLNSDDMDWPYLNMFDNNGNYIWEGVIQDWTNTSDDAKIYFTAKESSNYFVSVNGFEIGDFTLKIEDITVSDDYGSSVQEYGLFAAIDAADTSTNDNIISGDLETTFDTDWFKVSAIEGTTYEITLNAANMQWPYLEVLDNNGNYLFDGLDWDWNSTSDDKLYFTANETADYFVSVSGRDSNDTSGTYTLEFARNAIQDDFGSSLDANITPAVGEITEQNITSEELISGTLGTNFDSDWFKLSATQNSTYAIELDSDTMDDIYLNIIDSNGNYIWAGISTDWTATVDNKILFTANSTDDYYVSVDGWETGDYTLKVKNETILDDYTADIQTEARVTVGSFVEGNIETYEDADWIKVTLSENKTYQIDLEALNGAIPDTVIYGLYDSEGNYIANTYDDDSGEGLNSKIIYNSTEAGDYYISATAYNGLGEYKVSVNELVVTDSVSDDLSTIAVAEVGTTYNGEVDFVYDNDWIKINLTSGTTYQFNLKGVTLEDTYINGIYDANGSLIANTSNDDKSWHTLDSYIELTPSQSGNYFISVGAYDNEVGTYTLDITPELENAQVILTDQDGEDINNTTETSIDGILSTYIDGIIDYSGDTDWYNYTFEAGKEYQVNLYGSATDSGTLSDTVLTGIYDSNGDLIASTSNNDGGIGRNSTIDFTAQTDGEYYIAAGASEDSIGTYQINVKQNVVQTPQEVTVVDEYSGSDESWTIMVYLAADNNLEAMALDDINEMELANLPDNVNVTFLIDRADGYDTSYGDWTDTRRGVISHDNDMYSIGSTMESIGEQNTGDGQVLTDFINWSVDTASADNYGLVIWNHGGGISGVAWDETNGNDNLTIDEVVNSIEGSVLTDNPSDVSSTDGTHELGMLGFDTCLSGVVDMTYATRDVADIVVASEALEPGDGWDYTGWFNSLTDGNDANTTLDSTEVATSAVSSFGEFYDDYYYGTTLSAVDTDLIDEVVDAFGTLNTSLDSITQADQLGINNELRDVAKFGSWDEYMDIGDLAQAIDNVNIGGTASNSSVASVDGYAKALEEAVDNAVIAQASTVDGTTGISTYYPGFNDQNYLDTFEVATVANMDELYTVLSA